MQTTGLRFTFKGRNYGKSLIMCFSTTGFLVLFHSFYLVKISHIFSCETSGGLVFRAPEYRIWALLGAWMPVYIQECWQILSPTRKETSSYFCQNGMNLLRCLTFEGEKNSWWQLASRYCWTRALPWHASETFFLPGRAKDLSAPWYIFFISWLYLKTFKICIRM